jgi:hypothetical protein
MYRNREKNREDEYAGPARPRPLFRAWALPSGLRRKFRSPGGEDVSPGAYWIRMKLLISCCGLRQGNEAR